MTEKSKTGFSQGMRWLAYKSQNMDLSRVCIDLKVSKLDLSRTCIDIKVKKKTGSLHPGRVMTVREGSLFMGWGPHHTHILISIANDLI